MTNLNQQKKQLDVTIKSSPRVRTLKEAREKKKFEKLVEKQSHNYENVEYAYLITKSAFEEKSTQWIVRKKLTEYDNKHDIIFYGDEYGFTNESLEHEIVRADAAVILNNPVDRRKRVIEEEYNTLKGITVTEKL